VRARRPHLSGRRRAAARATFLATAARGATRALRTEDRTASSAGERRRDASSAGGIARCAASDVVVFDDEHRIVLRTSRQKIEAAVDRLADLAPRA
jgi:hypothetical protein